MKKSTKRFVFLKNYLFISYIRVCFQLLLSLLNTLAKELTGATRAMQSFSYELSTLVSVKAKCKQTKAIS